MVQRKVQNGILICGVDIGQTAVPSNESITSISDPLAILDRLASSNKVCEIVHRMSILDGKQQLTPKCTKGSLPMLQKRASE